MRIFVRGLCLFCVLAAGVPARSAEAAAILDQVVLPTGGGLGSSALAQTFTVGLAGELVGVDVAAWSQDPFVDFYLLGTTAGVPDASQILASSLVSIPFATRVGGFQPTIFFSPVSVSVGDVLAIALVIHYGNGGGIGDWTQTATPYIGGMAFNIPDGANGFAANLFVNEFGPLGIDAGFRTYIDADATTPVPEPATLFLLGLGLAGAKMRLRQRKQ